jgi:hypothetical protein
MNDNTNVEFPQHLQAREAERIFRSAMQQMIDRGADSDAVQTAVLQVAINEVTRRTGKVQAAQWFRDIADVIDATETQSPH